MSRFDRDLTAKRIKSIRTQKGLSQEKFGQLFTPPINKSIVSRWESGSNLPSEEHLIALSEIGHVTIDSLYRTQDFQDEFTGENLKRKRQNLNLSKKVLGKLVGVSKKDIKKIEQEDDVPDDELAHKLYDELVTHQNDFKSTEELSNQEISDQLNRIEEKLNYIIANL